MRDGDSQNFCFKQTIAITAELLLLNISVIILLCFDTVGWVAGRASGL